MGNSQTNRKTIQKIYFRLRDKLDVRPGFRRLWWGVQGTRVGAGTRLQRMQVTWPHQVEIGQHCTLEEDLFFKFDGIWSPGPSIVVGNRVFLGRGCEFNIRRRLEIGSHCLIASGCKFIDHDHGIIQGELMGVQHGAEAEIILEEDVWLGVNVVVLKGVRIGRGAVVAAGAVVTKSIGPNEIWGGIPARKIKDRPTAQEKL